jgi:hypothetical protein
MVTQAEVEAAAKALCNAELNLDRCFLNTEETRHQCAEIDCRFIAHAKAALEAAERARASERNAAEGAGQEMRNRFPGGFTQPLPSPPEQP